MKFSNYLRMDPHLLVGMVNTALRNEAENLDDLVKTYNLELSRLVERLKTAGYKYCGDTRQFR